MPEAPEIKSSCVCLSQKLDGKNIIGVQVNESSRYHKSNGFPGMDKFTTLNNIKFGKKGKKIIISSSNSDQSHIKLIFGYGMEGRLVYAPTKHTGVVFQLGHIVQDSGIDLAVVEEELYFHDSRHMGHVNATYTQQEYDFVMKDVGPDLLDGEVQYPLFEDIVTRKTRLKMGLAEFLMEQKYMSGIGNYLRAEILYKAKLSPYRSLGSLSETDRIVLYNSIIEIIYGSYACGGLTIHTYISPDNTPGTFKIEVYGKDVDSYGNKVATFMDKKKRNVHWVPAVQI
jgi:formamidopyrimidine-DNA glycosylase